MKYKEKREAEAQVRPVSEQQQTKQTPANFNTANMLVHILTSMSLYSRKLVKCRNTNITTYMNDEIPKGPHVM